jgi:2-polyprenyl-3-methyl-5-hydroxy-6-metoxy-1,4-benzoquinol methylase
MSLRKLLAAVFRALRRTNQMQSQPSPSDIVKANTKEAFDLFYTQDEFIAACYLSPGRLALYDIVAEYCTDIFTNLNVLDAVRVIDIGCGTGHMLEAIQRKLISRCQVELFGIDFAEIAVSKAKSLLPTATFESADLYQNSLTSNFFDLVLCIETLEHLRWPEKALIELLRICKPRGSVVVTVPNGEKDSWDGHVNFWSVSKFTEFLSSYGLVDMKLLQDDTVIIARLAK